MNTDPRHVRRPVVLALWATAHVIFISSLAAAQDAPAQSQVTPVTTTLLVRTGLRSNVTLRYVEILQTRGRWVVPDVGYIDFGEAGQYREVWLGGGPVLIERPSVNLTVAGYYAQDDGSAANGAKYFQVWSLLGYQLAPNVVAQAVYLGFAPLNDSARVQHLFERIKLEYDFGRLKLGGGYAAYRFATDAWQHRPFVTGTVRLGRAGSLELWGQRLSGDLAQLQVRYALSVVGGP